MSVLEDLTNRHVPTVNSILDDTSRLPDSYLIGLWGYCEEKNNNTKCTPSSLMFWFDLPSTLGLSIPLAERIFPGQAHTLLNIYQHISRYIGIAFVIVVSTICLTIAMGFISTCFRRGSILGGLSILVRLC